MGTVLHRIAALAAVGCLGLGAHTAGAQADFPNRPIRMIVPFAPGGTTEVLARIIANKMGEHLGQQLVVDTRPGAAGSLGTALAAKSTADGHTLLLTSLSPVVINVNMRKAPYDPQKDLTAISPIIQVPSVLAVHAGSPIGSIAQFLVAAKAAPGKISYGSSGAGGVNHLIAELFRVSAGIQLLHVPYKGAGPAVVGLLSKQVDTVVSSPVAIMPHVRSGQIQALAVSGSRRSPALPGVPTMAEAAVPGFEATAWYGLLGPAGIPAPIVQRVHEALVRSIASPDVAKRLATEGAAPETASPEAFARMIREDIAKWRKAIEVAGAKLN